MQWSKPVVCNICMRPLLVQYTRFSREILQQIKLANRSVKQVYSKTCLGLKVDSSCLKWDIHALGAVESFNRKLNLLKSFHFLPLQARLDFYFKVILPSISYGILTWGSVGKTVFDILERTHIRAARNINGYAWDQPSIEVQRLTNWRPLKIFYNLKLLN